MSGFHNKRKQDTHRVHRTSDNIYMMLSESGSWYEVAFADGRWVCDCPGFKYRGTECRHIRKVRAGLESEPASEPSPEPVRVRPVADDACPRCGAASVKSGRRHNKSHTVQRYLCRACGLRFSGNYGFEGQRADRGTVTDAINLHLDGGMSSRQIQRHLKRHGLRFSHVSVCNWIRKYSGLQEEYLDSLPARPGRRWHADEIYVNGRRGENGEREGEEVLLAMSGRERFVLAHAESPTYKKGDGPHRLFEAAKERWGGSELLVTDKRPEFRTAHRDVLARSPDGKASKHLCENHNRGQHFHNNVMERLNGTFRDHLKSTRRVSRVTSEMVQRYVDFYNFVRPHMGLDGDTPAERAGIVIEGDDKMLTVIQNATRHAREAEKGTAAA